MPTLQEFEQEAEKHTVNRQVYENLVSFKYTDMTVYKHNWNNVTLHARGIVFDRNSGKVLARPFDKFFNYEELVDKNTGKLKQTAETVKKYLGFDNLYNDYRHQKFIVTDKIDGSLGILFYTGSCWAVKTSGAFDSDQAKWANNWCFVQNRIDTDKLDKTKTYLFEIVYNEDPHPIKYDFEGLVLLSVIDTETGKEESYQALQSWATVLKVNYAQSVEFESFDDLLDYAKKLPNTKEGVVVTFENGFKMKLKSDAYLQLQKVFRGLSKNVIYESFDWKEVDESTSLQDAYSNQLVEHIPEELVDMKEYATQLLLDFKFGISFSMQIGERLRNQCGTDRKKAYLTLSNLANDMCANDGYKFKGAIMKYYVSGKVNENVRLSVYRAIKP